jgi:hypothetical protein
MFAAALPLGDAARSVGAGFPVSELQPASCATPPSSSSTTGTHTVEDRDREGGGTSGS